jgi:hypothetical protein
MSSSIATFTATATSTALAATSAAVTAATGLTPTATDIPSGHGCFDNQFGPWAGRDCRGGFDFTLLFEESILVLPVQALFLYMVPVRLFNVMRQGVKVRTSPLRLWKFVSGRAGGYIQLYVIILSPSGR